MLNEPKININNNGKKTSKNLTKKKSPISNILINKKNEIKKNRRNLKKDNEIKKISKFESDENKEIGLGKNTSKNLATDDFENKKTKKGWWSQSTN